MLEEKEKTFEEIPFVKKRKDDKLIIKYQKDKKRYFVISIFLSVVIIALFYFLFPVSNIKNIEVNNNVYLDKEEIIELSKLTSESKYLLTIPSKIENRIKNNDIIFDCVVSLLDDNVVSIDIFEKKALGYYYDGSKYVLLLSDDTKIDLNADNMYFIEKVPLIVGFSDEYLLKIEDGMSVLDNKMINEISEIHYYPELKYQYVEIIMVDGCYVFTSPESFGILNKYYDMKSLYGNVTDSCFYFEDISGNAYISSCPWVPDKAEIAIQE